MTYESEFGKVIDANIDTTGPGTTGAIDIQILSQSESLVEVTDTSHDTKLVERELVSGDVVETVTEGQNGSFVAESGISKSTDKTIFGITHSEGGGGSSGGMTLSSTYEADLTFTDDASSSESTETTQSGSYNDEGEYSGTSTLTRTLVDDYFSEYQGDSYWESDDIIQVIDFEREAQGETTRTFSSSETYSNEETTASWTSSFETTWSWSTHADILEFGYHTIFNDSDSGTSDNDDSGTYTPNNNPIPFYQNFRLRTLIIMVVGGGQPGAEESAGTGTEQATGQGQVQNNSIAGAIGQLFVNIWNFLNSRSGQSSSDQPGSPTAELAHYQEGENGSGAPRTWWDDLMDIFYEKQQENFRGLANTPFSLYKKAEDGVTSFANDPLGFVVRNNAITQQINQIRSAFALGMMSKEDKRKVFEGQFRDFDEWLSNGENTGNWVGETAVAYLLGRASDGALAKFAPNTQSILAPRTTRPQFTTKLDSFNLGKNPSKSRWDYIKAWHDKRVSDLFGSEPGVRRRGRAYDSKFKGRDIEYKSSNFGKGSRTESELKRMDEQITKDIYNRNNGTANPHWHFEHDPRLAPEMEPLLKRLDQARIKWTWGPSTPTL